VGQSPIIAPRSPPHPKGIGKGREYLQYKQAFHGKDEGETKTTGGV